MDSVELGSQSKVFVNYLDYRASSSPMKWITPDPPMSSAARLRSSSTIELQKGIIKGARSELWRGAVLMVVSLDMDSRSTTTVLVLL
jgi:hypothetical protein